MNIYDDVKPDRETVSVEMVRCEEGETANTFSVEIKGQLAKLIQAMEGEGFEMDQRFYAGPMIPSMILFLDFKKYKTRERASFAFSIIDDHGKRMLRLNSFENASALGNMIAGADPMSGLPKENSNRRRSDKRRPGPHTTIKRS